MQKLSVLTFLILLQLTTQEDNWQSNVGDIANFIQSKQGKNIVETLLNGSTGGGSELIFNTVVSTLNQQSGNFYFTMWKTLLATVTSDLLGNFKDIPILSEIVSKIMQELTISNMSKFLSTTVDIIEAFIKTDGFKGDHSGHDWLIPPFIEKIHVFFEILIDSPLAKKIRTLLKKSKLYMTFSDENGNFSLAKFGELMENHSFRQHIIGTITYQIAQIVVRILDPNLRTALFLAVQGQINSMLKMEGFPKSAFFNMNEPVESCSAFVNYVAQRFLGIKIQSKRQVKIMYETSMNIYNNVLFGRYFNKQLNASDISNTLTNILNMDIIEPVARTYRGYRFAKKHSECDKYVICLINNYEVGDRTNLPVIKTVLTKLTSLISTWFLSQKSTSSFYSLLLTIIENNNCKNFFYPSCEGFHAEEIRVKRKYEHQEL